MPTYCFVNMETGKSIELTMTVRELEEHQSDGIFTMDDGTKLKRDYWTEKHGHRHCPGNYPFHSVAAGVGIKQRRKAIEEATAMGIPTHFDEKGRAVFESKEHRRKYCEAVGLHDLNGGYSDPMPQNREM